MLVLIFPIQCYVVWQNTVLSFPWHTYSWSAVHGPEWNTIFKHATSGNAFFDRWVPIAACFLVFVFFGCGKDANELYWSFLRSLGLDRCFACLDPEYSRRTSMDSSTGSSIKLLFNKNKRWSSTSRYTRVLLLSQNIISNNIQNLRKHQQHPHKPHDTPILPRHRKRHALNLHRRGPKLPPQRKTLVPILLPPPRFFQIFQPRKTPLPSFIVGSEYRVHECLGWIEQEPWEW